MEKVKVYSMREKDVEGIDKRTGRRFKYDRIITKVNGKTYQLKSKGTAYETLQEMFDKQEKIELHHDFGQYTDNVTGELKTRDVIYVVDPDGDHLEVKAADSYAKNKIVKALTQ